MVPCRSRSKFRRSWSGRGNQALLALHGRIVDQSGCRSNMLCREVKRVVEPRTTVCQWRGGSHQREPTVGPIAHALLWEPANLLRIPGGRQIEMAQAVQVH